MDAPMDGRQDRTLPPLRLQLLSDLHIEFLRSPKAPDWLRGKPLVKPHPDADLLVLAGDIDVGIAAVETFGDWPVPVLYVPGNHEAYGHDLPTVRRALRERCAGTSIVLLDGEVVTGTQLLQRSGRGPVPDSASHSAGQSSGRSGRHLAPHPALARVRFIGTTLWAGYRYPGSEADQAEQMAAADRQMVDVRTIRIDGEPYTAERSLAEHRRERGWLTQALAEPFDGTTVVITHHAPSTRSVHPRFAGSPINGAFATDLPELLGQAQLWLHGHTHDSFDYVEQRCRVVANPRGYIRGLSKATADAPLVFENAAYEPLRLLDVPLS
jgi:predicted phosphodiesterase